MRRGKAAMTFTDMSVLGHEPVLGSCDLCAEAPTELTDTVSIRRNNRAIAVLSACARCGRAARRISAIIGPNSTIIAAETGAAAVNPPEHHRAEIAGEPILVHEFTEQVLGEGRPFLARIYASQRTDGTWVAWIAFLNQETGEMRSTSPETSQSKLSDVVYWAGGIEPTYLEGAFHRATRLRVGASWGTTRKPADA